MKENEERKIEIKWDEIENIYDWYYEIDNVLNKEKIENYKMRNINLKNKRRCEIRIKKLNLKWEKKKML